MSINEPDQEILSIHNCLNTSPYPFMSPHDRPHSASFVMLKAKVSTARRVDSVLTDLHNGKLRLIFGWVETGIELPLVAAARLCAWVLCRSSAGTHLTTIQSLRTHIEVFCQPWLPQCYRLENRLNIVRTLVHYWRWYSRIRVIIGLYT